MNRKILFIAGTHGDEPIGRALLKKFSNQGDIKALYKSVIGNPRALAQNKRFTEVDLNRVAPGDANSPIYEIKRASELVTLFKQFDYIIDFHETKANDRIIIIIPRLSRESLALALAFNIDEILIWPSSSPNVDKGPLVRFAQFGIEIECGTKNSFESTCENLTKVIIEFLKKGISRVEKNLLLQPADVKRKKFYLVYGKIDPREVEGIDLQDFGQIDTGKEKFVALLFGKHQCLKGYKMRVLDSRDIFDMLSTRTR